MPLGRLRQDSTELVVLAVLADRPLYGYAVGKQIAARSRGELKVGPGQLYPLLSKLQKQGLLDASWEEVRADRGPEDDPDAPGRRRKWYGLTPKGRRRLEQRIEGYRSYAAIIEGFIEGSADA